jgi:hypothetical protein
MDLVVNGPLKAAIRRSRCGSLVDYMQSYQLVCRAKEVAGNDPPKFAPPKVTLSDGMRVVCETVQNDFAKEKFKAGIRKSFIQVGLTKDGDSFRNFTLRGSLGTGQHPFKEAATSGQVTLDEIAVPLELTQVEGKDSDGEDVSEGGSVSESDV